MMDVLDSIAGQLDQDADAELMARCGVPPQWGGVCWIDVRGCMQSGAMWDLLASG
jgi:hypothetical protein